MIYSVWVPGERRYDYYSVGELIEDDTPAPKFKSSPSKIGYAPGQATWELPKEARAVGSGPRARGVVVHPGALGDFTDSIPKWGLYAIGAVILWRVLR